jgi:single-strand DNA-binding protein
MAGSLNQVELIGNCGQDPDIKSLNSGDRVANLSIATSETWKDKTSGERKEKTEWHRIVVFGDGLVKVIESYVRKGSKIYIQGSLQTRSWEKDGVKQYATEIVLKPFNGKLLLLDGKSDGGGDRGSDRGGYSGGGQNQAAGQTQRREEFSADLDDEIPF